MPTTLTAALQPIIPEKYITPLSTIMQAYDKLLEGNGTGQILEASGQNLYFQKQQAYPDEVAKWIWEDGLPVLLKGMMG